MEITQITIGKALAFLDIEDSTGIQSWGQLSKIEKEFLNQMRRELGLIKAHNNAEEIIKSLPKTYCKEDSCLEDNQDFFLACLIVQQSGVQELSGNNGFFSHMNSCCKCFEIFAEVFREYFYQFHVLSDCS